MSDNLPIFAPGDRVQIVGHPDTATVVEVFDECPDCGKPALRPGMFPDWPGDLGLWHQEHTDHAEPEPTEPRTTEEGKPPFRGLIIRKDQAPGGDFTPDGIRSARTRGALSCLTSPTTARIHRLRVRAVRHLRLARSMDSRRASATNRTLMLVMRATVPADAVIWTPAISRTRLSSSRS